MRPAQQLLPLPLLLAPHLHIPPPRHVPNGILQLMKINPRIEIFADEEVGLFVARGDGGDAHAGILEEGRFGIGGVGGGLIGES